MKVAHRTMSYILKDHLALAAYKKRIGHSLTDNLKKQWSGKIKITRYAKGCHRFFLLDNCEKKNIIDQNFYY